MPEISFSGIHHVALNVHDLEESVSWYTDVLGFAPLYLGTVSGGYLRIKTLSVIGIMTDCV